MDSRSRVRVGAVNYLNTKPLIHSLEQHAAWLDLVLDLPSRLADRLAAGELDVALIPSLEYFQNPDYSILSDACIGCRGPVLSVKLFSRVPLAEVKTLALDEGSRTSAGLVRILLGERFGLEPHLQPLPIGSSLGDTKADAVLLIGDRAMHAPREPFAEVWDLGEEWTRATGMPFVFAMWTARPGLETSGVDLAALEQALSAARTAGVADLPAIAHREAPLLGLSESLCLDYLRENLYFYLGERELAGLRLFYQHAKARALAPPGVDVGLTSYQSTR